MPAVGSSNMKTFGSSAISIATSSLRWSPCDSAAAGDVAPVGERDAVEHCIGARDQLARGRIQTREHVECTPRRATAPRGARSRATREVGKQVGELERAAEAARGCARAPAAA